ncbi:MAG: tRNA-dihydrouridine synthase family protein [Clostridiales bacterium]|nr:tRNA-dihydrouridine synthase family protein [Clostridiales bacterium]
MTTPVYFAPMEGITDATFRRVHHARFSGVSKYFIPFISPTQNLRLTARELAAVAPEQNAGVPAVPQVLVKDAQLALWAVRTLADMGYAEVNLNFGCPSGTVTAKGKGAGMLADVPHLERFLGELYAHTPLPVSVKARIGITSPAEFERLLPLLCAYPISELILHPRTRAQFYKGQPHRELFAQALSSCPVPLCYNGDLFTPGACEEFMDEYPRTRALMLGRGLVANPALAQTLAGGEPLTAVALRDFHDELEAEYLALYPAHIVLGRLREVMKHAACCFEDAHRPLKAIRKAATLSAYREAVSRLFDACPLRENPGFTDADAQPLAK